ncbi:MAG TPA: recombinase family protein [Caldilinea sp.]|nr:recombinase family protein [Caldilinea sp.]
MPNTAPADRSTIYGGLWLRYRRRSRVDTKRDRFSVERQLDYLDDECERLGITATKDFIDAQGHRSARREETRPDYQRLKIELMESDAVGVMFPELDRAWRSVRDTANFVEWAVELGKHIIIVLDRFNTVEGVSAGDLENLYTKAARAQGESDKARERMGRHIHGMKKRKIPWGFPPFGTKMVGEGSDRKSIIVESYASTVRQMIEWHTAGKSARDVMNECNLRGLKHLNRKGEEEPFKLGAVQSILNNTLFYAGFLILNSRRHSKDDRVKLDGDGTYLERYARATGAERTDRIEPVISTELAEAHIERRWKAQRTGRPCNYRWPALTRILWLNDGERSVRLYCHRDHYRTHATAGFTSRAFRHADIDGEFLKQLSDLRFSDAALEYIQAQLVAGTKDEEREHYAQTVKRLQMKLGKYREMYADGLMEREEFHTAFSAAQAQIDEAQRRLAKPTETMTRIAQIGTLGETLMQISERHRRDAIAAAFERVELNAAGEFVKVIWAEEFRSAFAAAADVCRKYALDRCRTDTFYIPVVQWFAERAAA